MTQPASRKRRIMLPKTIPSKTQPITQTVHNHCRSRLTSLTSCPEAGSTESAKWVTGPNLRGSRIQRDKDEVAEAAEWMAGGRISGGIWSALMSASSPAPGSVRSQARLTSSIGRTATKMNVVHLAFRVMYWRVFGLTCNLCTSG